MQLELIELHEERAHHCIRPTARIRLCTSLSALIHLSQMIADIALAVLPVPLACGMAWSRLTSGFRPCGQSVDLFAAVMMLSSKATNY
jgi:hypothetical protein